MTSRAATGERVSTSAAGFNPTWQRHRAAYGFCDSLLPPGRVIDLGCGVGHSFDLLAPRETVGVDLDEASLRGQSRQTVVADMRSLPFEPNSFDAAVAVQSLEHVPDPERVLAEAARVVRPGGTAIFVTPNRLTFGVPDEIIDPYHCVEFDCGELRRLVGEHFEQVRMLGLFGSDRYMAIYERERRELRRLLARDPLGLRRAVPVRLRRRLYDWRLRSARATASAAEREIAVEDFSLGSDRLEEALDLFAVAAGPSA